MASRSSTPAPRRSPPSSTPRSVGRPRSATADRAILDAAAALLGEVGVNGLTMSGVVDRSGVARATIYRRYPTREALTAAVLARVKGREPFQLTGDIADDMATAAHWAAAILGSAEFRRLLPLFVAEVTNGPAAAKAQIDRLAPNHGHVSREYASIAAAAGYRTDIEPGLVGDMIIGTMLMRYLSTGRPPDADAERQLVDVLERGLRAGAKGAA
jgi:AcrR family transcriptional regulator